MTCVLWIQTNSPTCSNLNKCLETSEKVNKIKYLDNWLKKCQKLTPLVASVNSLLGVKAEATFKLIASHLMNKRRIPTLVTMGTRRVGLRSLLSGQHTTSSKGAGFRPRKSVWNNPSGRTAQDFTSIGKGPDLTSSAYVYLFPSPTLYWEETWSRVPGTSPWTQLPSRQGMSL